MTARIAARYKGEMRFAFTKCHGSGNDFALIAPRDVARDTPWPQVARALADRRGPVGSDGLLLLTPGDRLHDFGMLMMNPDGSEAETCLNGLRCVARAGFEALGIERARVRLKTSSAEVARDTPLAPGVVTVRETVGPVDLDAGAWIGGLDGHQLVEQALPPLRSERRFTAVAMPNPHLVTFVETVDEAELNRIGTICEAAPAWLPGRANVSFVEVRGPDALFVRTCERGVGPTDSCGSAMAAASYVACLTGRTAFGTPLVVRNAGGLVRAEASSDGMVTLSGNATFEWEGTVEVNLARGEAGDLTITRHFNDEIAAWSKVVEALD